jgi:hypothetical protein
LDLDLLSNFTAAWRPMHVKSDVFCSASLVLPDKVGRQINIGGWAFPSTIGIRLYWPDGEPGVWGTNDWQENADEVSLLTGRWYPTAMIMVNGSILVMGGEVGSNGAPVPSLEILPSPPGVTEPLYCDYLERTDPYNLYPYLVVLPSGGIAVFYYNEARILNEVTLETDRVLPNIPGAVNDFLGGRTYPLEGTAMTLPQYAPYTEPLTVVICGGSIPGPEYALDNCVSIQPEVTGANWTIERMVSCYSSSSWSVLTFLHIAFPKSHFLHRRSSRWDLHDHEWRSPRSRRFPRSHRPELQCSPLRSKQTSQSTNEHHGKQHNCASVPLRSDSPPRWQNFSHRLRPRDASQRREQLHPYLSPRIPRRSLLSALPALRPHKTHLHTFRHRLRLRRNLHRHRNTAPRYNIWNANIAPGSRIQHAW